MDKDTFSNYGWIIITTIVLSVMLAFATPFTTFVQDAVNSMQNAFIESGDRIDREEVEKEMDEEIFQNTPVTVPLK